MDWKFKNWLPFEEEWKFSLIFQSVAFPSLDLGKNGGFLGIRKTKQIWVRVLAFVVGFNQEMILKILHDIILHFF